jgi:fatty-acyl-CoA synthase
VNEPTAAPAASGVDAIHAVRAARAGPAPRVGRALPHWPAHVDPTPPAPRTTLPQCLAASSARHPAKAAIIFGEHTTRYTGLLARSNALAGYLQQRLGVAAGDRVLLIGQNSPQWVEAFYAVLRAGAVVVPVNPMCKAAEVAFHAADSGARVAVLAQEFVDHLTWGETPGSLRAAVVMAAGQQAVPSTSAGPTAALSAALSAAPTAPPGAPAHQHDFEHAIAQGLLPGPMPTDPDALAVLPYTSGTTGKPKGCRHSHATLLASIASSAIWKQLHNDSVVLTVAPLFHMLGLQNGMNLPIFLGATAVMMYRWHAESAAQLMEQHRVTAWSAPPAMVMDLFAQAGTAARDLSSLALLSGGGAAMPQAVAAMLLQRFGIVYQEAYGLSETASFLHANPPLHCKQQCLGMPTQGVDSRIVDPETLAELPPGLVGELVTRAPQVMLGYWGNGGAGGQNEAADAAAFITLNSQRFFRTGDLALVDEDGYFFLKDRLKRMINVSGYKVWPAEVESALYAHPAVQEACVIAVPGGKAGEVVKALVVLKPGWPEPVSAESFISWCREQMAVYKAPRLVEFVASLPRASTGKVAWRALQEAHAHLNPESQLTENMK